MLNTASAFSFFLVFLFISSFGSFSFELTGSLSLKTISNATGACFFLIPGNACLFALSVGN
jgi:hypothetical protein